MLSIRLRPIHAVEQPESDLALRLAGGVPLHDLGVVLGVADRRDVGRQLRHIELPAGHFDLAAADERVDHADLVHRPAGGVKVADAGEDHPVLVEVEVLSIQPHFVEHRA
jgi:hypothetical protein